MASSAGNDNEYRELTQFEIRRADLVGQIGDSLENVLAQINALNRSLEGIIEIGNEFAQVEALWSQFENVTGNNQAAEQDAASKDQVNGRNGDSRQA